MKITRTTHILFIVLVIVVVFSGSLKNDFAWDDKYLVVNNPYIKSWDYLPQIFTTQLYGASEIHSNFYRPFQLLSFAIDYSIWGLNPFGYHLTNLFLHIFNAILVYLILIAIGPSSAVALLVALLFGTSPAISGITYYISARSDLLMALFIFLSFLLFVKYRKTKNKALYIFSVISFTIAILSKEMAVILVMFLCLEIFRSGEKIRDNLTEPVPYLIILAFYAILRFSILNFAKGESAFVDLSYTASIPLWRRILTDFIIIPRYLGLLLFPYGLHMEWFIAPARTIFQMDVVFFIAILGLLIFIVRRLSHRHNLVLFGALWFLLSLLPVLNIYPVSVFFGEGWLYVPSVGFFIILAIIFQNILSPRIGRLPVKILIGFFIAYFSLFTISYGNVWKDSISLFRNVLKYEKHSPFIHLTYNNLGMAYYDRGDIGRSIEYCKDSISSNPRYAEAYNNLGVAYMATGHPIKAMARFKKAISLKRGYTSAYCNLAHAYNSIGLKDRAIRFSKAAIKIDPRCYKAYCNLGYIFSGEGDTDKAIEFFRKACEIKKGSYEPHYCLGSLYIKNNRFKEALDEYETALGLGLGDYEFYNELAFLYIKNRRFKEAEHALMQSIRLNKDQSDTHNNLGNLYSMAGELELATEEYKKALAIDPANTNIRDNLEKIWIE